MRSGTELSQFLRNFLPTHGTAISKEYLPLEVFIPRLLIITKFSGIDAHFCI